MIFTLGLLGPRHWVTVNGHEHREDVCNGGCSLIVGKVLTRLLMAIGLWILLTAGCFLYSFVRPSSLAYVALALLYGWYVYIPLLLAVVSIAWLVRGKMTRERRTLASRL